jgi:hypothetical protein
MDKEVEIYFDLETTALGPKNSPGAEYRINRVLMAGWSINSSTVVTNTIDELLYVIYQHQQSGADVVLVAHNLMFDLKYLLRHNKTVGYGIDWTKIRYRCTMVEEYRRSGHRNKYPSLEFVAKLHNIPFKKGLDLGAIIASGKCVSTIPKDDLRAYLIEDIEVLLLIPEYPVNQQYLLALASMELNGLPIDIDETEKLGTMLVSQMNFNQGVLEGMLEGILEWSDGTPIKPNDLNVTAPRTISYVLTGFPEHGIGAAKDKKVIQFISGADPIMSDLDIPVVWGKQKPNPNLGFPINASIIEQLRNKYSVVDHYAKYKEANKLLNTYIKPFLAEANKTGGFVHPSMNTTSTATGRLSSSGPNGQNMPPRIRNLVVSKVGRLYDIDFSQLEMVGAATLSGDVQMRADLRAGFDLHYLSGKKVFGWKSEADMTKDTRRIVKGVNFGLLYGGGPKGITENTGADIRIVKKLIDSFYSRYPKVEEWQEDVLESVKKGAWAEGVDDKGVSYRASTYTLPDHYGGRKFYFEESLSPAWMKDKYSFKPTETKNYPIQGFAGGDIVMTALAILYDLIEPLGAVFRMTVHDSILIDWFEGKEGELERYMEEVCKIVREIYKIQVPLNFEIQEATYWL